MSQLCQMQSQLLFEVFNEPMVLSSIGLSIVRGITSYLPLEGLSIRSYGFKVLLNA